MIVYEGIKQEHEFLLQSTIINYRTPFDQGLRTMYLILLICLFDRLEVMFQTQTTSLWVTLWTEDFTV